MILLRISLTAETLLSVLNFNFLSFGKIMCLESCLFMISLEINCVLFDVYVCTKDKKYIVRRHHTRKCQIRCDKYNFENCIMIIIREQ